jgi:hypothetical protein
MRARLGLAGLAIIGVGLAGCWHRPVREPVIAYERFAAAVTAGDATALYHALDRESQWSIISTQRYYRQIVELCARSYPPEARARELARVAGAEARRPAVFFAAQSGRRGGAWVSRFAAGLGHVTRIETAATTAVVHTDRGGRYALGYTPQHGWGFAGLRAELEELKARASHDVDTARENAKIYEQSAERRGAGEAAP